MGYTLGPWKVDKHYPGTSPPQIVIVHRGEIVATIVPGPTDAGSNARLIAAAPDLLESLKGCHDAIGELAEMAGYSIESGAGAIGEWLSMETGNPSWQTLYTELLAAIAKAEAVTPA